MSEKNIILLGAIAALASVNIAAFRYLNWIGLFVAGASVPFAMKLLERLP